ncbi:MAG: electron transfer flavoprotein subunit alpha/FixB family protein [Candidatus Geothermarchaeales archaeon]
MSEILLVAEHRRGAVREITYEMITKGRELAEQSGSILVVAVLGEGNNSLAHKIAERGPDKVIVLDHEALREYTHDGYETVLASLIRERRPVLIMMGHTAYGTDFAPSLAAALEAPFVSGCVDLGLEDGVLVATRQFYQGRVNAEIEVENLSGCIVTVRPTEFAPAPRVEAPAKVESVDVSVRPRALRTEVLEFRELETIGEDISQADVIVSVGRGIGEEGNVSVAQALADALGGVLGASRPVTDQGWLPKDKQVGQTGKTVKPKLYIALGISGAMQHIMGMKSSDVIIAINKDPNAPIFDYAHYGVVADLFDVVSLWTEKIREERM